MGREELTPRSTAEIKRLVARGQYRVDPRAVAEAMIRRGALTPPGLRLPVTGLGLRVSDDRRN